MSLSSNIVLASLSWKNISEQASIPKAIIIQIELQMKVLGKVFIPELLTEGEQSIDVSCSVASGHTINGPPPSSSKGTVSRSYSRLS